MQNRECGLDVWTGAQIRERGLKHRPEAQTLPHRSQPTAPKPPMASIVGVTSASPLHNVPIALGSRGGTHGLYNR
jgi:hypothetical protein